MADPSPAEPLEGQEPESREGQEPDPLRSMKAGHVVSESSAEPDSQEEQRSYSPTYVKQLRREAAASRARNSELEEKLQAIEDAEKTEAQRERERAEAAEKERDELKLGQLRLEVAGEYGLALDTLDLLHGSTREEIELRAEKLKTLLDEKRPPTAGFDGGARAPVPETKSPEEAHTDFLLRSLGRPRV